MRFGQDAQCAGHQQMPAFGLGAASLLIDQETVGVDGEGERDGRMLAGIQEAKGRVGGRIRRISHQCGGCAIQARTVAGVCASCSSAATVSGTSTRM
jgi:hypothetical protein